MEAMALECAAMTVMAPPPKQHGSGWTGQTKRIWMLLYSEGGLWTAAEIADRLRIRGGIYMTLREMVDRRLVSRQDGQDPEGERLIRYSVTRKCKVPREVEIEEIEELLMLAVRPRGE